ncbi:MAG: VOC family protein, partial [OCS116 cluster bacterium]|nr:VOC family protein [OCS116 cluster bacterium]
QELRNEAMQTIAQREIFTPMAISLVEKAERDGGLNKADASLFVSEVTETFKWHAQAKVSLELYNRLHDAHRLIADIVSFKGPHINHLTPRTLDIDTVQELMPERGITPKAVIEGPPQRQCAILLRQTSFKALEEKVQFTQTQDEASLGTHTARFGEIEQRGIALTPKGHTLYDELLSQTRAVITPAADGSNAAEYNQKLNQTFADFPDDWDELRRQELAYFSYSLTEIGENAVNVGDMRIDSLIKNGLVRFDPIIYEDFLPVSAAGIFQSNLGDNAAKAIVSNANQPMFEADLGIKVMDSFAHYADIQQASLANCLETLGKS